MLVSWLSGCMFLLVCFLLSEISHKKGSGWFIGQHKLVWADWLSGCLVFSSCFISFFVCFIHLLVLLVKSGKWFVGQ